MIILKVALAINQVDFGKSKVDRNTEYDITPGKGNVLMKKARQVLKAVEKGKLKSKPKTTENDKKAKANVKKVSTKVEKSNTKTKQSKKAESKKSLQKKKNERRTTSLSEKAYKDLRCQAASEAKVPEKEIVTVERRKIVSGKIGGSKKALVKREKVARRRQIDPTTCERDYTQEEIEFMGALDEYKRQSGRMFPTCSEILEVFRNLGYEKQTIRNDTEHHEMKEVLVVNDVENPAIEEVPTQLNLRYSTDFSTDFSTPALSDSARPWDLLDAEKEGYTPPFGVHDLDDN